MTGQFFNILIKEEITPIAEEVYKPRISRNKRNSGSDN